ncbi:MAG TPA: class D sortase [Pseudogracilibacillus sp.]|nr:class D sortase [Pseudogracilibacillus sp.]
MLKKISILFIIIGLAILTYGGLELYTSSKNESKRLDDANTIISEEVIYEFDQKSIDYDKFGEGDTIGVLYIPKLEREIPIVEGTDEEELAQGVGHYEGTGFPGENKQILLSGHRDTVFRQFGDLENGDEFHVKMEHGTFIYAIEDNEIVSADDTTVIDPNRKDEVLTVSTCYPFSYIGSAPDRYVVYAYPIVEE